MLFAHLGRQFETSTFRLTLVIAGLFVVCVAVLFATIDWYAMGTLQTELRTTISARLAAIMENHTQSDAVMLIRNVKEVLEEDPGAYVLLLAPDGRRLAGNMTASTRHLGWTSLRVPSTEAPKVPSISILLLPEAYNCPTVATYWSVRMRIHWKKYVN